MKKNNTVLITGASGFIGQYCVKIFKEHGYYVIGIDRTIKDVLDDRFKPNEMIEGRVTKILLEQKKINFNLVIHCAGSSSVNFSYEYPYEDYNSSVQSTIDVLEYIRVNSLLCKFILISSAAVYGNQKEDFYFESDDRKPVSPYGFHKLQSELLCEEYSLNHGLSVAIIRVFSAYGEGLKKQLLWDACNKFLENKEKTIFFGSGEEKRDWIHVEDIVSLVLVVARSNKTMLCVNAGTGYYLKINRVIEILKCQMKTSSIALFSGEKRCGDPISLVADISFANTLGWKPAIKLEQHIGSYVDWFKKQKCV